VAAAGSLEADLAFLSLIARKVDTIRDDLGAAGAVLTEEIEAAMLGRPANPDKSPRSDRNDVARALNRLERNLRERIGDLAKQLQESMDDLHLHPENVERVTAAALELSHQSPLRRTTISRPNGLVDVYEVPPLTRSWALTTTDLYDPIADIVRPITFDHGVAEDSDDVVLAHLGHRLVAQAMRTLRAEIWASGADVKMGRVSARIGGEASEDLAIVAYARLVLVGGDGRRLHEEVITAAGRVRNGSYARWNIGQTDAALAEASYNRADSAAEARISAIWPKISESVYAALESRAEERISSLRSRLAERAEQDIETLTNALQDLEHSIGEELGRVRGVGIGQLAFDFDEKERDQLRRNIEALERRIAEIPEEIEKETAAVRSRYAEPSPRLFPAAVEFLVPRGGTS